MSSGTMPQMSRSGTMRDSTDYGGGGQHLRLGPASSDAPTSWGVVRYSRGSSAARPTPYSGSGATQGSVASASTQRMAEVPADTVKVVATGAASAHRQLVVSHGSTVCESVAIGPAMKLTSKGDAVMVSSNFGKSNARVFKMKLLSPAKVNEFTAAVAAAKAAPKTAGGMPGGGGELGLPFASWARDAMTKPAREMAKPYSFRPPAGHGDDRSDTADQLGTAIQLLLCEPGFISYVESVGDILRTLTEDVGRTTGR